MERWKGEHEKEVTKGAVVIGRTCCRSRSYTQEKEAR